MDHSLAVLETGFAVGATFVQVQVAVVDDTFRRESLPYTVTVVGHAGSF